MMLVCDLCGGTLEMRNGNAVCQGCGLTYSMETLREKMGKATPTTPNPAPAPVAPSRSFENQLNLIRMYIKSDNKQEAQKLCNQILTTDYDNADVWELKIQAAFSAYGEVETFFGEYMKTATTPERKERLICFARKFFLDKHSTYDLVKSANLLLPLCPDVANKLVRQSLEGNIKYMQGRLRDFQNCSTPEDKALYLRRHEGNIDWTRQEIFIRGVTAFCGCEGSDVAETLCQLCDAEIQYAQTAISSKCVESYTWMYKECEQTRDFYTSIRKTAVEYMKLQEERKAQEIKRREQERLQKIAEYWGAHPEEKRELETKRNELQLKINKIQEKFNKSEQILAQTQRQEDLKLLKTRRNSIGLFKFKEKKALDEEINSKEIEILRAKKYCDELENQKYNQVKELQYQIQKINDRLSLTDLKPKF